MKKGKSGLEDDLRPEYDLDKLKVVAYGPAWNRPRRLQKKGQKRALNPKMLVAISNPALTRGANRKG
jgi:hypothetical protein